MFSNDSKLLSNILTKNDSNLYFWNYISLFLTEHEVKRFLSLRNIHTGNDNYLLLLLCFNNHNE